MPTENCTAAADAFLEDGAPMPERVDAIGRWHAPGSRMGWLLCDTDNPVAVAEQVAEWAHLLEIDVNPVIRDDEAGEAATRARSS